MLHLSNARIVQPGHDIFHGDVVLSGGKIALVSRGPLSSEGLQDLPVAATRLDCGGRLLTPGLIDVHTHGVLHNQYETSGDALRSCVRALGQFGVTTVVPTAVPTLEGGTLDAWFARLREVCAAIPTVEGARVPGLHLEGPFMAICGAACATLPGDLALVDKLLAATGGALAVMSVSPEVEGILPVIERLVSAGVKVFLTHTGASVEQTERALAAGATHATHFYDVFPVPKETDPGVRPVGCVEAVLAHPTATVDFIADGVHVHPAAIRAAVAAKGWEGVSLITDSNIGAGLPEGVYPTPWGFSVKVSPCCAARHAEKGWLAGSALTMDVGMANLRKWMQHTRLTEAQVWAMGTRNPAGLLGLGATRGRLEAGWDADLVLWEEEEHGSLTALLTLVGGAPTWTAPSAPRFIDSATSAPAAPPCAGAAAAAAGAAAAAAPPQPPLPSCFLERLKVARDRGVAFIKRHQRSDGALGVPERDGLSPYYKGLWALAACGLTEEASRLATWVARNVLDPEGNFSGPLRGAGIDCFYPYPGAWLAVGAARSGRWEVAHPALRFLLGLQDAESGGFRRTLAPGGDCDVLCTSQVGNACLAMGRLAEALRAGAFLRRVWEAQPKGRREGEFFFAWSAAAPGGGPAAGLIVSFEDDKQTSYSVRADRPRQPYYNIGIAAAFLARLSAATGDGAWAELGCEYLGFAGHVLEEMCEWHTNRGEERGPRMPHPKW